jgi:hypothetical protein
MLLTPNHRDRAESNEGEFNGIYRIPAYVQGCEEIRTRNVPPKTYRNHIVRHEIDDVQTINYNLPGPMQRCPTMLTFFHINNFHQHSNSKAMLRSTVSANRPSCTC